jgi:nucleotide-binding universal stress UspA family protein
LAARFSKILVAVDGSEESFKAAQYAIALAKKDKSQLIALTVNQIPSIPYSVDPSTFEKLRQQADIESKIFFDRISTYGLDIDSEGLVQLRTEIIDSVLPVHAAIVNYAEKENADLIVIGTRGKTGFKRVLLGSVASGVVTYATCPVLVVK